MINAKRSRRGMVGLALITVVALTIVWGAPVSAQQTGTTLTADLTAVGHSQQVFSWDIAKAVSPDTWTLPFGETGTSQYTITVLKVAASDEAYVDGQICVTNGGSFPTENLQIVDVVQVKAGSGAFQDYASAGIDLSAHPVLAPGESACYPYHVTFSPVAGVTYRSAAQITITNHAGWIPGGKNCVGPTPCPFGPNPKADFSLPGGPDAVENGTITVSDSDGAAWSFSDSGSVSYTETFTCDGDQGMHPNVATILETGQSASASVQVNCDVPPDPGPD